MNDQAPSEDFNPDFDLGVNYNVLRDDQMPDDCYPVIRRCGNTFRSSLHLPVVQPPPRAERLHKSKFVFKDTSGRVEDKRTDRQMIVADYDGAVSLRGEEGISGS